MFSRAVPVGDSASESRRWYRVVVLHSHSNFVNFAMQRPI